MFAGDPQPQPALTDSSMVSSAVCAEFPELEQRWGFGSIEALAESLLSAEIQPLLKRFTELFADQSFLDRLAFVWVHAPF
jgi:hypothetical protein